MNNTEPITVHLDIFEGPLDLLLYLIKKNNLDIYNIPISHITGEYLAYLDVMKDLNLEIAGEFLVVASTLMQIKAQMLLPSREGAEEEEGPDPRAELAAKLAEYQKYKEAAKFLDKRFDEFKNIFYRGAPRFSESEKILDVELFDLIEAVKKAMVKISDTGKLFPGEEFPIEVKIDKILSLLEGSEWILIDDIFAGETRKLGIITCFIALLELIKLRKILARQDAALGEIRIYRRAVESIENEPVSGGAQDGGGGENGTGTASQGS